MNHLVTADVAQIRIAEIDGAAAVIRRGGLVGIPTETVYGLAADATNPGAVAGIYHAKGRPRFNPLIIHVSDFQTAREHGVFDGRATTLAERFWPGPLTLVVPAQQGSPVSDLARAGLASVALRAPAHPIAAALLRAVGLPLAAPSANRSGRVSATTAAHVSDELGAAVDLVLDGGPARIGLESTIIGLLDNTPRILRAGGLPRELIEEALGVSLAAPAHGETLAAPGMLASHYAPHAPLRMKLSRPLREKRSSRSASNPGFFPTTLSICPLAATSPKRRLICSAFCVSSMRFALWR